MRFNRYTLRWLLGAALLVFFLSLIPWGFIIKVLLIVGVVYFALNLKSDRTDEDYEDEPQAPHGFHDIRQGSSAQPSRRCIFSSTVIDLTDSSRLPDQLTVQAAFSSVTVRLPVDAGITIHASGALCSIAIPGRQNVVLGQCTHRCGTQDPRAPQLYIEVDCMLSSVVFRMG